MNMKWLWVTLLVAFAATNLYAFIAGDWAGLVNYFSNLGPWGILATVDLLMALTVALAFVWRDAKSRNVAPLPYLLLTLGTGSIGLLWYLVKHGDSTSTRPAASGTT